MPHSTLAEWLQWLESCHPTEIDLGLERIAAVAGRLGIESGSTRVVTIGGTNGKGSCVAALQALCLDAGLTVGSYTSPHLLSYNERVCLQGQPVPDAVLTDAFERVYEALQGQSLTYFEFGTLAALDIFQRQGLDVILLEVGLGGRLDAVNIIDSDISVVTSIALDHQEWLGADREAIGREKAGIFRRGRPAICADPHPPQSVLQRAREEGANLLLRGRDFDLVADVAGGPVWWSGGDPSAASSVAAVDGSSLPLQSVAAALQVAQLLGIEQRHWGCLRHCALSGRYQRLNVRGCPLVLDVAHNPEAATLLAERLGRDLCDGRRLALFAVMADKDIGHIMEILKGSFDQWWLASLPGVSRAAAVDVLSAVARDRLSQSVEVRYTVVDALHAALATMQPGDELVVFGSFFTVATVLESIDSNTGRETPLVGIANSNR